MFLLPHLTPLFLLSLTLHTPPTTALSPDASSGCTNYDQGPILPGSRSSHSFSIDSRNGGGERHFLLHVPRGYRHGVPVPLILAFHGEGMSAEGMERVSGLSEEGFWRGLGMGEGEGGGGEGWERGAVVVYPEGVDLQWTGQPTSPHTSTLDDRAFISDLLSDLLASLCLSTTHIHAYGYSSGGALVDLLACTPSIARHIASFAAVAPSIYVDSALSESLFSTCPSGGRAIPMVWMFGTEDPVVDIEGVGSVGGRTWGVELRMKGWAGRNGCEVGKPNVGELWDGRVERWSWDSGLYGDDVVQLYKIKGWGHGVPSTRSFETEVSDGTREVEDDVSDGVREVETDVSIGVREVEDDGLTGQQVEGFEPAPFDASTVVVEFFKKWPLGRKRESRQSWHDRDEL